jgi:hypothetical protein
MKQYTFRIRVSLSFDVEADTEDEARNEADKVIAHVASGMDIGDALKVPGFYVGSPDDDKPDLTDTWEPPK